MGDRLHPTDDEATTIHVPLIPEFDIPFDGSGNGERKGRRMGRMDGRRAKIESCENERDKSGMRNEERDGWSGKWRFTELYTEQRNEK